MPDGILSPESQFVRRIARQSHRLEQPRTCPRHKLTMSRVRHTDAFTQNTVEIDRRRIATLHQHLVNAVAVFQVHTEHDGTCWQIQPCTCHCQKVLGEDVHKPTNFRPEVQ